MIKSLATELMYVQVPEFTGELRMLPFDMQTLKGIPEEFMEFVRTLIAPLPDKKHTAWFTLDGRVIEKGKSHRRPGVHIDGNYIPDVSDWGGGSNGWKVGEGGRSLSSDHHKLSYENENGGLILVSNYPACRGWIGSYDITPGIGGDLRHSADKLDKGFMLKSNTVYYGNSRFIHESLPVENKVHRVLARITLPMDYPVILN
jgi:hypothetical protein